MLGISVVGDDIRDRHDLIGCAGRLHHDRDRRRQLQLRRDLQAGLGRVRLRPRQRRWCPPATSLTASLEIDKSLVKSSGHPGASSWQICYAARSSFTALPGTSGTATIGGVTYNTGLLPDCSSTQGAPCVQARHKANAGDVVVTFLALRDPFGHG